ncbi:MAG: hypothetical protein L0Y66_18940 [Myxococcaceae bacterium]|nr:hypothetical protein [Myxococcaceae bacterium]MCI0672533.1 hypothetical protein [Myxococcaceae bacterium]
MRLLFTLGLALLLLAVQSVALQALGISALRVDVTVILVAFLALRANRLEGAAGAFALGYLLDLVSGRPTGLFTFLAVGCFLLGQFASTLLDVRTPMSFVLFAAATDATHGLLAAFFTWLTSRNPAATSALPLLPWQVLLTALAAFALYPVLRRIDPGNDRREVGALR